MGRSHNQPDRTQAAPLLGSSSAAERRLASILLSPQRQRSTAESAGLRSLLQAGAAPQAAPPGKNIRSLSPGCKPPHQRLRSLTAAAFSAQSQDNLLSRKFSPCSNYAALLSTSGRDLEVSQGVARLDDMDINQFPMAKGAKAAQL